MKGGGNAEEGALFKLGGEKTGGTLVAFPLPEALSIASWPATACGLVEYDE